MAGRRTNLALFWLLLIAFTTGGLAFAVGTEPGRWIVVAHGIAGIAIVALTPWKTVIARRGLQRRTADRVESIVFSVLVVGALVFGFLHSSGLYSLGAGLTSMQLHVGLALALVPLLVRHSRVRRQRTRATDVTRRNLLRAGVLAGGAGLSYLTVEAFLRIASLPGAARRRTGSLERGTGAPETMPVTQWLDDPVPAIEASEWTLTVRSSGGVREWSYGELEQFDDRVVATIDCTGGWYAEQEWEGVWLARLVDGAEGRSVAVSSVTGYGRAFPIRDVGALLVATKVGGRPLSQGHGFPARIVAPGRRGFWWVKWTNHIEVRDTPWWLQAPFPLT